MFKVALRSGGLGRHRKSDGAGSVPSQRGSAGGGLAEIPDVGAGESKTCVH